MRRIYHFVFSGAILICVIAFISIAIYGMKELRKEDDLMEPVDTIYITKTEYEELIKAKTKLEALECGGVDNWDGYDDAMEVYAETMLESENK